MLRELNLNEMEAVSGGIDEVVVTGTIQREHTDTFQLAQLRQDLGGGLSHGGLGVFGQIGGGSFGFSVDYTNSYSEVPNAFVRNANGDLEVNPEWQAAVDDVEIDWAGVAQDLVVIGTAGALGANPALWQAVIGVAGIGAATANELP